MRLRALLVVAGLLFGSLPCFGQTFTRSGGAINAGSTILFGGGYIFSSSDVGQTVLLPGAALGPTTLNATIVQASGNGSPAYATISTPAVNSVRQIVWTEGPAGILAFYPLNALEPSGGDDTAGVQAALNAAATSGTVYLGPGIFHVCNLNLPVSAKYSIQGTGATTLEPTSGCTTQLASMTSASTGRVYIRDINWEGLCQVSHDLVISQGHAVNILSGYFKNAAGGIGTSLQYLRITSTSGAIGYSIGDTITLAVAGGTSSPAPLLTVNSITATTAGGTTGSPTDVTITTRGTTTGLSTGIPALTQASTSGGGSGFTANGYFGSGSNILIGNSAYTGQAYENVISPAVRIDNENDTTSCYQNPWNFPAYNVEIYGTDNTFERFAAANAFIANIFDNSGGANVYLGTHPYNYLSGSASMVAQDNFLMISSSARMIMPYADSALYAGIEVLGASTSDTTINGGTYFWGLGGSNPSSYGVVLGSGGQNNIVSSFQCEVSTGLTDTTCVAQRGQGGAGTVFNNNQPSGVVASSQAGGIQYRIGGAFFGSITSSEHFTYGSATGSVLELSNSTLYPTVLYTGTSGSQGNEAVETFVASSSAPSLFYCLQANAAPPGGANTGQAAAVAGLQTCRMIGEASDGTAFQDMADILMTVEGTVSSGVIPGDIKLRTANSSGVLTTGLEVTLDQHVIIKPPTSCSGLATGTLYNNSGTPAFCP